MGKIYKNRLKLLLMCLTTVILSIFILTSLSGASEISENAIKMPIIMYHSVLKDKSSQNDYVISPDLFESDLKYFKENGYTTVTVNDLIDYVYSDKLLPQKCVMLTFDDGYYNNYKYVYPLLKKYGAKAVISPIAKLSEDYTAVGEENANYGHLLENNIKEMNESGFVEFQNHSYNMHSLTPRKGIGKKYGESDENYRSAITSDISKAQDYLKNVTGKAPTAFVYPFGEENSTSLAILKEQGFLATLNCTEKLNYISKSPESLYELGRFRRDNSETTAQLMERISKN